MAESFPGCCTKAVEIVSAALLPTGLDKNEKPEDAPPVDVGWATGAGAEMGAGAGGIIGAKGAFIKGVLSNASKTEKVDVTGAGTGAGGTETGA